MNADPISPDEEERKLDFSFLKPKNLKRFVPLTDVFKAKVNKDPPDFYKTVAGESDDVLFQRFQKWDQFHKSPDEVAKGVAKTMKYSKSKADAIGDRFRWWLVLTDADTLKVLRSDSFKTDFQPINNPDIVRLLRGNSITHRGSTDERAGGISVSAIESFKSKVTSSKASPEKLEKWLKSGKAPDAVFVCLHLHDAGKLLFYKPRLLPGFNTTINPGVPVISTLTKQYGDDALFNITEIETRNPHTKTLAIELQSKQPGRAIFEKNAFPTWANYVDDLNNKYPKEPTWMYSTLKKYVNDNVLFQMIDVAKTSEKCKAIVTKVEDEWLQAGLQSRKTPEKALSYLGIGKTTDPLLESSLLTTWAKYTEAFNGRYPEQKTTMIETLTKSIGDFEVTRMLHTGKERASNLVANLESAQLKMWLDSGKSTDDVFKLLKLDNEANIDGFRDKTLLSTWISYINVFIEKNPDTADVLLSAWQSRLNDRPLNQILNLVKKSPSMDAVTLKMQANNIPKYHARNESPWKVFKLLALDNIGDGILGKPLFHTWMKYVDDFNKRNPEQQQFWFEPLRIECEWGGIRMIDMAMRNPSTVSIGKMVEREWFNYWLDGVIHPKTVFRWLDLDGVLEHLLADSRFKRWITYLEEFNQRYPDKKTTVVDELRPYYSDSKMLVMFKTARSDPSTQKIAINLENALINKWFVEKKTPDYLRSQLGNVDPTRNMINRYETKLKEVANTS
ncbi:Avirulence (Avh) protein [Phytophthora megakarya]|uniref:Avirulence (Avh) protein n=1 Tax=Phytophthora megakarya TaxID=4795 RepID=A0A225WQD6_9STRA|nr:Avirulence (Avh) protein [Phytophthora megakarya]